MNQSENNQEYPITEAIAEVKKNAKAKFDESIEVHARLAIDPKKSDQQVRGVAELPHGTGKKMKIAVFTTTQKKEAEESGADIVGGEELIDKIKSSGKIDADMALATPEMMPKLAVVAKILGPKGLMPNPKTETVTTKIKETVEALKKGKASFKNDNSGNVHQAVGKLSYDDAKLVENVKTFIAGVEKSKPAGLRGKLIANISLTSTMGVGLKIA